MDENAALLEPAGTTQFSLQVEVEEDIEQELDEFVRFKRLGKYDEAHELFQEVLLHHIPFFPVVAEYADLLLEQRRYGTLSEFLDIQIECMGTVFEEEEVELLRIMRSLALVHTKGALRAALEQASKTWMFLHEQHIGEGPSQDNMPSAVQISAFEIYIEIIVFAMNTSSWVNGTHLLECPWQINRSKWAQLGFMQWYQALSENGDSWSASRVLIAVLKILPNLSPEDQKLAFSSDCFGNYRPNQPGSHPLREDEVITGFLVSLSRSQALMDLALLLRLRYPDGFQDENRFTDWYLPYIAALKYHSLASHFLSSIQDIEGMNPHRVKFEIQDTRLSKFQQSDSQLAHKDLYYIPERLRIFPEWVIPLVLLSGIQDCSPGEAEIADYTLDIPKLLNIQLHENEDMIGYIETCALLYAAPPRTACKSHSVDDKSDDDGSPPSTQAKFGAIVLQTLDVALWLTEREPSAEFKSLIMESSSDLVPLGDTEDAAVQDFCFKEEDNPSEVFDIPLYLLFLHMIRGTSAEALYNKITPLLPHPISHLEIETTAGIIRHIFEAEIESRDSGQGLSFFTNEIPLPIRKVTFPLLSTMSAVLKACQNSRRALQSIKEKCSLHETLDIGPSTLALETSLEFAEKDTTRCWYDHIFHCGFRCEKDDSIAGSQLKSTLAVLENLISSDLNPADEREINREITAGLFNLYHKSIKGILFDQRKEIESELLLDNQPRRSSETFSLLTAVENGLDLSTHAQKSSTNPFSTGSPWYPDRFDKGSRHGPSGLYSYPQGADSLFSRDSGYGSRAASAYSRDRSTYGSLNFLSKSKDKGRSIRSPVRERSRSRSRSRSTHRLSGYTDDIVDLEDEAEDFQTRKGVTSHDSGDPMHSLTSNYPPAPPSSPTLAGQKMGGYSQSLSSILPNLHDFQMIESEPPPIHDPLLHEQDFNQPGQKMKQRYGSLSSNPTEILSSWFQEHLDHPYPSFEDYQELKAQTGLSIGQISNWFISARRRDLGRLRRRAAQPDAHPT